MTLSSAVVTKAQDPGRLRDMATDIAAQKTTSVAAVERCLDRISQVDPVVRAWREVDAQGALEVARARDAEAKAGYVRGPLHGIPVGIKDIIDVAGVPTRCNSRSRADASPATLDAEIVLQLRTAGAVILGKTHTTEFAFFDPSPACNPHHPGHTPGGSSSGSAAALAAGMAPLTVGTQTVASVNRPAAYCGIAAFKPSTRSITMTGIAPLGPSYDTVGFYGWTVDDAVYAFEAVAPDFLSSGVPSATPDRLTLVVPDDAHLADISPDAAHALDATISELRAGGQTVERRTSPISFARLFAIQRSTMLFEAGRAMASFLDLPAGQIGEKLLGAIREGLDIPLETYLAERAEIDAMRRMFFTWGATVDAFLWPATPATAPAGLAWTGDPKYISPWTALGGPIVSVPTGKASNGLPLGAIIASAPGTDHAMCAMARRVAELAQRHD